MEELLYNEMVETMKAAEELELQYMCAKIEADKARAAYLAYCNTKTKF